MNMQINYVGVLILLWIVSTAWIVSGYAAKGYRAKNTIGITLNYELYAAIRHVLDYCYDTEREHYIETFGEESNNYLWLDSDLDLHVEKMNEGRTYPFNEGVTHIFQSLHYLQKQLVPGDSNA
jgi:hypothetical protein